MFVNGKTATDWPMLRSVVASPNNYLSATKYTTAIVRTTIITLSSDCRVGLLGNSVPVSRFNPDGVSSSTQARTTATGKPIMINISTILCSDGGRSRMGAIVATTCSKSQAAAR